MFSNYELNIKRIYESNGNEFLMDIISSDPRKDRDRIAHQMDVDPLRLKLVQGECVHFGGGEEPSTSKYLVFMSPKKGRYT